MNRAGRLTLAVLLGCAFASPAAAFVEVTKDEAAPTVVARPLGGALDESGGTAKPERRVEPRVPEPLSLIANRVTVEIRDQVAIVRVVHILQNNTDRVLQARYVLPLGERAHVAGYAIWEKGVKLPGELMEVSRAESLYREVTGQKIQSVHDQSKPTVEAVRRPPPRDPGLLRQTESNEFETHVYPFFPWQLREVELLYAFVVPAQGGASTWRFPYELAAAFKNAPADVSFDVRIADTAGVRDAACEWPGAVVTQEGSGARVQFSGRDVAPKSFGVSWRHGLAPLAAATLAHKSGARGHALVRVALPGAPSGPQPLDVVFARDASGSLAGKKARDQSETLERIASALGPRDRGRRLSFSDRVVHDDAALEPLGTARPETVTRYGVGRTCLAKALRVSLGLLPVSPERQRLVVLATDGVTMEDPDELLAIEPTGARLLIVATGQDDDLELLGMLADRHGGIVWVPGRGACTALWADMDRDIAQDAYGEASTRGAQRDPSGLVARFREPAVTSARLVAEGLESVYPLELSSYAAGGTATFLVRYSTPGPLRARFEAWSAGAPVSAELALDLPAEQKDHRFVASFWAKARVDHLLRLNPWGRDDPNRAEVVALSLEHRFVTPYTAFLSLPDAERRRLLLGPNPPDDAEKLFTFAAATPEAEVWVLIAVGLVVVVVASRRRAAPAWSAA